MTGVEILDDALNRARAAQPARDERYIKGVAENLPMHNDSVDAVISMDGLRRSPSPTWRRPWPKRRRS